MKYERFIKNVVPHGTVITVNKEKYLTDGEMYVKLPKWCGSVGVESKDNSLLAAILNDAEWSEEQAYLTKAILKNPDDKGKDIIRVFSDSVGSIYIKNDQYGLIEKNDMCIIAELTEYGDATEDITALLVGKQSDIDNFEPDAIILHTEV